MGVSFFVDDLQGNRSSIVVPVTIQPGLWIPGWDGPPVGLLTPKADLELYGGPLQFKSGTHFLEGYEIVGRVEVSGTADVTIKNCWGYSAEWYTWRQIWDMGGTLLIEDCELGNAAVLGNPGSVSISGDDITVRRSYIHHTEDGIKDGIRCLYEQCIIDNLWGGPTAHADGIQMGGSFNTVRYCNISGIHFDGTYGTSAILMKADWSPMSGIVIENNHLTGGQYVIHHSSGPGGGITGTIVRDNVFGTGVYGPVNDNQGFAVWSGNVDEAGKPVLP